MAETSTSEENRRKLVAGTSLVTTDMVTSLERTMDDIEARSEMPTDFVVPGEGRVAACLDVARTVVRRAERLALALDMEGSQVVPYLNRLSDLCWVLARWHEQAHLLTRDVAVPAGGEQQD